MTQQSLLISLEVHNFEEGCDLNIAGTKAVKMFVRHIRSITRGMLSRSDEPVKKNASERERRSCGVEASHQSKDQTFPQNGSRNVNSLIVIPSYSIPLILYIRDYGYPFYNGEEHQSVNNFFKICCQCYSARLLPSLVTNRKIIKFLAFSCWF